MFIIYLEKIIKKGYASGLLAVLSSTLYSAACSFPQRPPQAAFNKTVLENFILSGKKPPEGSTLEDEIETADESEQGKKITFSSPSSENITISYSFHEDDFFARQFYEAMPLEYVKPSYDEDPQKKSSFGSEPDYEVESSEVGEAVSAILTGDEAQQAIKEIQYAVLLGSITDVSFEERRQLDWWIKFNPVQFYLEQSHAITQNINYGPLL